jgi:hypothetical protein
MDYFSIDAQASSLAEQILQKSSSGLGDLPEGLKEAEGGFTEKAGGTLLPYAGKGAAITAKSQMADDEDDEGEGEGSLDKCRFGKSDDNDEDDEEGDSDPIDDQINEREEEPEDKAEKSMVPVDDLMKSLDRLEQVADGDLLPVPRSRKGYLAHQFVTDTLSKSEVNEVYDLIHGNFSEGDDWRKSEMDGVYNLLKSDDADEDDEEGEDEDTGMEKSFQERFEGDSMLQEGYDVSPFLERQAQMLAAGLDQVRSQMEKSLSHQQSRSQAFNSELAKSLRGLADLNRNQNKLIKSLSKRLETVENQPMPRRGFATVSALHKSLSGEVGGQEILSKSHALNTLEQMAMRMENAPCGMKLVDAIAMVEAGGPEPQLHRSLVADIHAFSRGNR